MKMLLILAAAATAAPAFAETVAAQAPETKIPRMAHFLEWTADGDRGLYIRGDTGQWYYARVEGNCPRLSAADTLRFQTAPNGDLDRKGAIHAQGWRCLLSSVTASAAPPEKD